MKRLAGVAVVVLASGGIVVLNLTSVPTSCPVNVSMVPDYVEGTQGAPTAREALGSHLEDAARITEEPDDAKGFHTVTFRGYDADDDLLGLVVVEGRAGAWYLRRVDTCS